MVFPGVTRRADDCGLPRIRVAARGSAYAGVNASGPRVPRVRIECRGTRSEPGNYDAGISRNGGAEGSGGSTLEARRRGSETFWDVGTRHGQIRGSGSCDVGSETFRVGSGFTVQRPTRAGSNRSAAHRTRSAAIRQQV